METKAVVNYLREVQPNGFISYHSSGQVIDWKGGNKDISKDYSLAAKVAAVTGYDMSSCSMNITPGGLTPWYRNEIGGIALTIKTGRYNGENEVRYSDWNDIWNQNRTVGLILANEAYNIWWNSPEKLAKINELELAVANYNNGLSADTDKLRSDIRLLIKLTGDNKVRLFIEKKSFICGTPIIILNDHCYISQDDVKKILGKETETFQPEEIIGQNNVAYVPVRYLEDYYEIHWDGECRIVDLEPPNS